MSYLDELKWANSYERLPILMAQKCRDEKWFKALGHEWSATDNQWRFAKLLKRVFKKSNRKLLDLMMTSDELKTLAKLPEAVMVFRGQDVNLPFGLSWSLDHEVAKNFPFHARYKCAQPALLIAVIPKERIVALKLDREEQEAIILPPADAWIQLLEAKK